MTDATLYPRNFERDPNKSFLPTVIAAIEFPSDAGATGGHP